MREEADAIKAEIAETKNALKGRAKIPSQASGEGISFEVAAGGHSNADFELAE